MGSHPIVECSTPSKSECILTNHDIDLWCVMLKSRFKNIDKFWQVVSPHERDRACRFHFVRHRERFIICRGLLRILLSFYTGIQPDSQEFTYGKYGKPALRGDLAGNQIHFNVSHSRECILIAITKIAPVGVDVEYVLRNSDHQNIAKRFFSPAEWENLCCLPHDQRREAFYNCWTRKEAYIKAIGSGLSTPLDSFVVTLTPGLEARILSLNGDPRRASGWSLYHLKPAPDYVAALAIEHQNCRLKISNLNLDLFGNSLDSSPSCGE